MPGLVIIPFAASLVTEITRSKLSKEKLSNAKGINVPSNWWEDDALGIFCKKEVLTLKTLAHLAFFGL